VSSSFLAVAFDMLVCDVAGSAHARVKHRCEARRTMSGQRLRSCWLSCWQHTQAPSRTPAPGIWQMRPCWLLQPQPARQPGRQRQGAFDFAFMPCTRAERLRPTPRCTSALRWHKQQNCWCSPLQCSAAAAAAADGGAACHPPACAVAAAAAVPGPRDAACHAGRQRCQSTGTIDFCAALHAARQQRPAAQMM
jgi:hypothetical protein